MGDGVGDGSAAGFGIVAECGHYSVERKVADAGEREITRSAFLAFASLVDDPAVDLERLGEFVSVTVVETGQLWIFATEVFLRNLLHRRGDQSRIRRALGRLGDQGASGDPASA